MTPLSPSLLFIWKYNLLPSSLEANFKVFGLCLVRLKLPQIYLLSIDCLFCTWLLLMLIVFMPLASPQLITTRMSISNTLNRGHGRVNADGMLSTVWRVAYTVASCWGLFVCVLALTQPGCLGPDPVPAVACESRLDEERERRCRRVVVDWQILSSMQSRQFSLDFWCQVRWR